MRYLSVKYTTPIETISAMANTIGTTNFEITLWVIADTRFDLPHDKMPSSAESGN